MVISAPYPTVSVVLAFPDAVGLGTAGILDPAPVTGLFLVAVDVGFDLGHDASSRCYCRGRDGWFLVHAVLTNPGYSTLVHKSVG